MLPVLLGTYYAWPKEAQRAEACLCGCDGNRSAHALMHLAPSSASHSQPSKLTCLDILRAGQRFMLPRCLCTLRRWALITRGPAS